MFRKEMDAKLAWDGDPKPYDVTVDQSDLGHFSSSRVIRQVEYRTLLPAMM
jgi:hypothetical protein